MKKIVINKEEGIAEVIDRVIETEGDEIALVIPKGSTLGRSVKNFHLLKRESEVAEKSVSIESVDENILAFAKESGLESSHPLWRGVQGGMSDIVPAEPEARTAPKGAAKKKKPAKKTESVKLEVPSEEDEEDEGAIPMQIGEDDEELGGSEGSGIVQEVEEAEEKEDRFLGAGQFIKDRVPSWAKSVGRGAGTDENEDESEEEEEIPPLGRRGSRKLMWSGIGLVAILAIVFSVLTWSFGHAAVSINFKKTPWDYQGNFTADKAVSKADAATNVVPAQIFSTQKNITESFPASGSANVSIKARGTITVYNAYNSSPQQLVATTRFVTPDGKIFRLVENITVPGAKVANGQIVPSSIDTSVVADQPGPSYNVGPVQKLAIPGFQGSPKYTAFYGELKSGTSGGFTGTRAVPTASDVASAKDKVSSDLKSNLASTLTTSYPNNFKILDGATSVSVTKITVSTTTDASGNFSVYGEASLQAIGFDEAAFKDLLLSRAETDSTPLSFKAVSLNYQNVKADFGKGTVSFSLDASGTLESAFDPGSFKNSIAGKSLGEARLTIAALPGLADGKISMWPMWLWRIPSSPDKVQLSVD